MHEAKISSSNQDLVSMTSRVDWRTKLRANLLPILTVLAVALGIGVGFAVRCERRWQGREAMYLGFPGELFLRMLKCLILPLVISSIVSAVGSLDTSLSGKVAARAVGFYLTTTFLSVLLGILVVMTIRPGSRGVPSVSSTATQNPITSADTILDLIRNLFPTNIIEATMKMYRTTLTPPKNGSNARFEEWTIGHEMEDSTNMLGLIVFGVTLGVVLSRLGPKGKPLLQVFTSLNEAIMSITQFVIWLSPAGIFFLVTSKLAEMDDLAQTASQIGWYSLTVLSGIAIHATLLLPSIYFLLTRQNPFKFYLRLSPALTTAFATASSAATLPVTFNCLEEKMVLDKRITRFCLPIGASINMDGTALYEAVAALFIAQVRMVPLDVGKVISVSLTATAASIGAAGIPQSGLVTLVLVLNAVGLPPEDVSLILIVDWLLDRFRTALNVMGDSTGAGIVAHLSRKELLKMDEGTLA